MNLQKSVIIALALVAAAPAATAAAAVWPKDSASDLSMFVTLQRFQIYADHCAAEVPQLKPKFDSVMARLSKRIQDLSSRLLASGDFRGMQDQPVPGEIIFALQDIVSDARHNFERLDAAAVCPRKLQDLVEMDDKFLMSDLKQVLAAVQNMIQMAEKQRAR